MKMKIYTGAIHPQQIPPKKNGQIFRDHGKPHKPWKKLALQLAGYFLIVNVNGIRPGTPKLRMVEMEPQGPMRFVSVIFLDPLLII